MENSSWEWERGHLFQEYPSKLDGISRVPWILEAKDEAHERIIQAKTLETSNLCMSET